MIKEELIGEAEERISRNNEIFGTLGAIFYLFWLAFLILFFFMGKAKALALAIWPPLVNFPLNILYYLIVVVIAMVVLTVISIIAIWIMERRERRIFEELKEIS